MSLGKDLCLGLRLPRNMRQIQSYIQNMSLNLIHSPSLILCLSYVQNMKMVLSLSHSQSLSMSQSHIQDMSLSLSLSHILRLSMSLNHILNM